MMQPTSTKRQRVNPVMTANMNPQLKEKDDQQEGICAGDARSVIPSLAIRACIGLAVLFLLQALEISLQELC